VILDRGGVMLYYTSFSLVGYGKGCFWTLWSKFCRSAAQLANMSGGSTNKDTTLIVRGPPLCHRQQEQSLAAPPTRTSQSSMKSLMLAEVKELIPLIAHCICFGIVQMVDAWCNFCCYSDDTHRVPTRDISVAVIHIVPKCHHA